MGGITLAALLKIGVLTILQSILAAAAYDKAKNIGFLIEASLFGIKKGDSYERISNTN